MIYTTGTIAVSGNTVTGAGTEFNAALSLIRVGCTLIAISDPVQIFSITKVKSATSLSVTPAASPAIPAGTKFSILLSDSISVDGLAQDVAETLRYYQGKESEIADAVEFFSDNKDVISASKLASQSATTATNAATTATSAADSAKTYRDEAHEYANQTAQPYAYVLQPLPDVWIPFNDSLDMITGYGPGTKKVTINGEEKTISSDKVVSFSRASTATYINKSGVLTVAGINEPRFEREGLLIEGTRTNLLINSTDPSKWNKSTSLDVTETGTDSFGFNYGRFVVQDSIVGTSKAHTIIGLYSSAGGVDTSGGEKHVTISCRVKSEVDNIAVRILFEHYDGEVRTSIGAANLNLTTRIISKTGQTSRVTARSVKDDATGWIFFEATLKADTTENTVGGFVQYSPDTGQMVASGDCLDVTTPQIEAGAGASSFIVTGSAPATRASDMVTVPIKNNLYNLPFTVLCEVHKNWYKTPNAAPRVFDTGGHQTGAAIVMGFGSSGGYDGFPYCDIGGSNRRINENAGLEKMLIGMRVKSERSTCVVSNGKLSSETKTTWTYIQSSATIRIGGQTTTGQRHLFGHVRNFRVWHKALTDAQLSEIV
ncbi:TPA: phage head spike fiber domain-containing protein [Escherichia coli]|uniref:phage head spike fiber domain-containing protein n=1 Tax=Escherichia coli TaxID=562 RepID=UPI0010C269F7|nr:phage tail protein [Escherichia coli]GCU12145.1 phage tail fiber protein [Escherichia coli]HAG7954704.1 phage tail protein [Escherichia coli]HAI9715541.1 phage tail protein [Escherichia coli]HAX7612493.1 phage tail protein [Escherichia coli]HBC8145799.1 phage tail protein [Escherichia coli]